MNVLERVAIDRAAQQRYRQAVTEIRAASEGGTDRDPTPTEVQQAIAKQRELLRSPEERAVYERLLAGQFGYRLVQEFRWQSRWDLLETRGTYTTLDLVNPRLAVFEVALPPLRERPEDLHALAERFAAPLTLKPAALQMLRRHAWPGNVRELRSVVEQARLVAKAPVLDAPDLEGVLPVDESDLDLKRRTRAMERQLFLEALRRCGGRKAEAARLLGIDPSNWAYHSKRLEL